MSYQEVVEEVKRWPFYEQLRLMEELARTMQRQSPPTSETQKVSILELRGALKPEDGEIPSDEEIKEIIVGHLLEKYT